MVRYKFAIGSAVLLAVIAVAQACSSPTFVKGGPDANTSDVVTSDIGFMQQTDAGGSLVITPPNPTITTSGTPATQQFTATDSLTQKVVTPGWSLDNAPLGGIDVNGLFTAAGPIGGVSGVTAVLGSEQGTTSITVNASFTENPGGVSAANQALLKAGGSADAQFRWLYPYDKTVFPRGIGGPLLQLDGQAADAVYVHIQSLHFTYDGFYGGSNPTQVNFSSTTWDDISLSAGAADPVQVQVTKMSAGQVTGPITETWTIAQGSLHGTVYYGSYTSQLANGGATLRIKIGQPATVLVGSCNNCHSVSDNGGVLAASYGHVYDATYDLTKDAGVMTEVPDFAFCLPAVYPDGTFLLSNYGENIPGIWNTAAPTLYNTSTGKTIPSTGTPPEAAMPAFSPDGKSLVFNHQDTGAGHTLATMSFNATTKAFSAQNDIVTDTTLYPSWPQFTPDSTSVIYHDDTNSDFATWSGDKADLMIVDVATKKTAKLLALDGMTTSTTTYLPYGATETLLNYEPTVLPVAVGGYFWVVFTSRRYYGNMMTPTNQPDPWSSTPRKKLWVAAIDINGTPGTDSSHPAFYLPGQEFQAGNMRGFWALDPCEANGTTCVTADECCGGYCRDTSSGKVCVPPPGGCSQEYEICTTAGDCCGSTALCVNGHCATPPPN